MSLHDQSTPQEVQDAAQMLTPEQRRNLESSGFKILGDYPQVSFLEGKDVQGEIRSIGQTVRKPIVAIEKSGSETAEPISLNEALDSLSKTNDFKKAVEQNPTQFPRALISSVRDGSAINFRKAIELTSGKSEQDRKLRQDLILSLAHSSADFISKHGSRSGNFSIYFANLREDLNRRVTIFALLEWASTSLEREIIRTIDYSDDLQAWMNSYNNKLEELCKDPEKLKTILTDLVEMAEEKGIKWEDFCKTLFDFNKTYFPGAISQKSLLKDEINSWLQSLKIPEPQNS